VYLLQQLGELQNWIHNPHFFFVNTAKPEGFALGQHPQRINRLPRLQVVMRR
jgi:hypothetical protein